MSQNIKGEIEVQRTNNRFWIDILYVKAKNLHFEKVYDFKQKMDLILLDSGCPSLSIFVPDTIYNQITSPIKQTNLFPGKEAQVDEVIISHENFYIKHTDITIFFVCISSPGVFTNCPVINLVGANMFRKTKVWK